MSVLLNPVSPVITYYSSLPQLNGKQQEEWTLPDTHNSLTDWNKAKVKNHNTVSC